MNQETPPVNERRSFGKSWYLAFGISGAILILLLWFVLDHYVKIYSFSLQAKDVLSARIEAIKTIVQAIGGLLVLANLYWTARNVQIAEKNAESTRQTTQANLELTRTNAEAAQKTAQANLELTRDGKIADRYAKGVEQLSSASAVARIGAIFELERVAHDSERDHWPIMELLMAVARQQTLELAADHEARATPETQAIFAVLGRRKREYDCAGLSGDSPERDLRRIDFSGLSIRNGDFRYGHFEDALFLGTRFADCDFRGAWLDQAIFQRSTFSKCSLGSLLVDSRPASCRKADFMFAVFEATHFKDVNFEDAQLGFVQFGKRSNTNSLAPYDLDFTGTIFKNANLQGAFFLPGIEFIDTDFADAKMRGAQLRGVDLTRAKNLTREQVASITKDEQTRVPSDLVEQPADTSS
ncbi:MAG: pentapeptide repeat-containing protein [Armatimonadota bacterium]|nr:pentapeptide repeat-containing protein [Armatimonadota bacterium]